VETVGAFMATRRRLLIEMRTVDLPDILIIPFHTFSPVTFALFLHLS